MSKDIPEEHKIQCPTCNQFFDARDLGQAFSHGCWNAETKQYECYPVEDVPYSRSKKVGDSVEWTKDKKPMNLN